MCLLLLMTTASPTLDLHPSLRQLLSGLRWRIRAYVWLEGLSLAAVWLGLTFWISFALDYLPVRLGASELPRSARLLLLLVIAGGLGWVLWHYILRRTFVKLADRSLALLLERRYSDFRDSLVTSVELAEVAPTRANYSAQMLDHTRAEALASTTSVQYQQLFNVAPIVRNCIIAVCLFGSILGFFALNQATASQAARRLYLLQNDAWARLAHIEVIGVDLERPPLPGSNVPSYVPLEFVNRELKVAKGASLRLKVRANAGTDAQVVPTTCTVAYRTEPMGDFPAERGRILLSKYRDHSEGRHFSSEGKPFVGLLSTVTFDVIGYDHRLSNFRIEVVDSPTIIETTLDLEYPPYMVNQAPPAYWPVREQPYVVSGTSIPEGTNVVLNFRSNKPLSSVTVRDIESDLSTELSLPQTGTLEFQYPVQPLQKSVSLELSLTDIDNVKSERPHRVLLNAIPDTEPQIRVALKGIGQSVTPDVMIPIAGEITDDYGVEKAWTEVQIGEAKPFRRDLANGTGTKVKVEQSIDFRELRSGDNAVILRPQDRFTLGVSAMDKFNLTDVPHVGQGDKWQIDVVTPGELLSQLEVRELSLRRRFEQILDEMTQLRDSLVRVRSSLDANAGSELDLSAEPAESPLTSEQLAEREKELRILRVQRGGQQSEKSREETSGVAASFLDIREELINNRVDTEERIERLQNQIAQPLQAIVATQFPELDRRIAALEKQLGDPTAAPELADATLEQANRVLAEMDQVLQKMLDLESYNELIDLVRDLLKSQEDLLERTKQERKRQALEELQE